MSNFISNPSPLNFTSIPPAVPPDQTADISWSGGASPAIPYEITSDSPWLTAAPGSGSTPDSQTVSIDITGLAAGVYNGNLTISPTDYSIEGQGSIPFPMAAPGGSWVNAANTVSSNLAFSLTDSALYHALSFSNGLGANILTYLVKINRATNAVVWYVLTHTGDAGTSTFWNADLVCVSPDGTHVYMIMFHRDGGVGRVTVEQRLTLDGSLVATVDAVGAGFVGKPFDVDIATVAGVEYLAVGSYDVTGNVIHHLSVIRTSDMTSIFDHTNNSGTGAQTPTSLAFDASGNVWWAPLLNGEGFNNHLIKTTVPGGSATTYDLSAVLVNESITEMAFDPYDGTLLLVSTTNIYKYDISTGTPTFNSTLALTTSNTNLSGTYFNASGRLNGGARWMWQRLSIVNETPDLSLSPAQIITANSKAFFPADLDDQTNNPHISATVDMTMWTNAYTTASHIDQYAWFDIALPTLLVVPVVLTLLGEECSIDAAPATLNFSSEVGTDPASQTVAVTNTGNSDPIPFTATPSDSWISVIPSGTTPQDLVVGIVVAGLSAGSYSGSIVISSACNDVTINITLTVTPPPPPPPPPGDEPCVEPTGCPFTLGDGVEALGQRLYDPSHQFWTVAELTRYIVESLRTWNALASYWRDEFVFDAATAGDGFGAGGFGSGGFGGVGGPTNTWIDLTVPPTSLRPLTVTDQYLLEVIEYHLLEPLTSTFPLTWTGSRQFSVVDLQSALQRRRDETLGVTGCFITRLIVPSLPGRIALPNKVIELRRVAFLPDQNVVDLPLVVPMFQDDQWALQAFRQSFTTDPFELPRIWAQSTEPYVAGPTGPQLSFDVNPLPGSPGEYEVLVIQSGGILCESAASTSTIPDDWTWVPKFGALADLMSRESNAKDSLRAKYAEGRYRQGLALLASSPALLTMRVNNLPLQIDAIKSADEYQTTWETLSAAAQPMMALTAGLNLVALSPPPDAPLGVERAITAGVVRNAPVPVELTDCIQVGRDLWDVIIDYAQHLAAIKMGGAEFIATAPLYDRFMKAASLYNSKLREMGMFKDLLYGRSQLEPAMNPRYTLDGDPANG